MTFQIESLGDAGFTLKDLSIGECMHSSIGANQEAHDVFIRPSYFQEQLQASGPPLILYDVGLGLAANACLAKSIFSQIKKNRGLTIISFETKITSLTYALNKIHYFPWLEEHQMALKTLIEKSIFFEQKTSSTPFLWQLKGNIFQQSFDDLPPPDLIFYDLYSPQHTPQAWSVHGFQHLYQKAKQKPSSTLLLTYSSSTATRTALLLAGFYVGEGSQTAKKKETTLATTDWTILKYPLTEKWLEHWERSQKPLPIDVEISSKTFVATLLKKQLKDQNHKNFNS